GKIAGTTPFGMDVHLPNHLVAVVIRPPRLRATLKAAAEFRIIGNPESRRRDTAGKIAGTTPFGMDVHLPNHLVAVVIRPPRLRATL
ncbi:hypothetical protein CNY89_28510, partial [Amaricoccus sp. HAR-UPW-R2A-40]